MPIIQTKFEMGLKELILEMNNFKEAKDGYKKDREKYESEINLFKALSNTNTK